MPAAIFLSTVLLLAYVAWRRYLWAAGDVPCDEADTCPYSLTEVAGQQYLVNAPHQEGVRWLTEVFDRSADKYPNLPALQIPHTGDTLTFAELGAGAEHVASALSAFVTGPDQVVAVAMSQDNWQIVAAHLGILKAGGTVLFLDTTLPEALIDHMLDDAEPVVILTRGKQSFRDLATLDVMALPRSPQPRKHPDWLDDPTQRLAAIFYTSGTTGRPKGVECPHAGYVNLALSYADYFDLLPGMDATSLTSSLGYDGSVSEMFSAWVSGCCVVMLTKEQVRSGPDLVPILRDAEVTVLFCPPVLLTTLTPDPHVDLPYPICRYIVPAGEAFPSALVEPWTRGRRQIINTYGPTEASTDTSRQSLRPGEPVTIGSPLADVTYVILRADQDEPLPHGEVGELCIGGVQIARGYRNLPQETARKFITHPQFGRLYRTGDQCKIDIRTQRVHFLGRIDTQLKVRGHRVETQAVEDILQTQFSEIEAAVLDYQNEELIAFVRAPSLAPKELAVAAPAPAQWSARVLKTLSQQLPAPAIPSRIFLVEKFVMKSVSGKIDRECLPELSHLQQPSQADPGDIGNGLSNRSASTRAAQAEPGEQEAEPAPESEDILNICRAVFETSLGWDSVFADHGGHSIVIARLSQRLQAAGWSVSVRDLLSDCDTPRKVARLSRLSRRTVEDPGTAAFDVGSSRGDEAASRVLSVGLFTALQGAFLSLLYFPPLVGFLGLVAFAEIGEFFMTAHILEFVAAGLLMYLVALVSPFASLLWVMVIKLVMGGHPYENNVTPGVYPRWSRMHLRIWCIGRLENSVLHPLGTMFRSAPLMAYALRRLGARIGDNLQCAHDVEFSGPLHLLRVGDNVAIQTGAYIHTSQWRGQELHVGPVLLESGCKVGMRAAIASNARVGRGAWINPFTPILGNVGENEMWEGAPARCSGHSTQLKRSDSSCKSSRPGWLMETLNIAMQIVFDFWLFVVPAAAVSWGAATFIPVAESMVASDYFRDTPLHEIIWVMSIYAFVTTWATVIVTSVLTCIFIRYTPCSPGIYNCRSLRCYLLLYRMKKMNQVQRQWTWTITGQYLRALAGVRFPRVGASECDLMYNLIPEMAHADTQVFWSNGSFTNMLDHGAQHITLRPLDMPKNFFSGNNCVVESGQFPSNFLLGVSTPGSDIQFRRQMRSRLGEPITVAGNPPVQFSSAKFEQENEAHALPGFSLFLARILLNDIFSIGLLPMTGMLIYVVIFTTLLRLDVQVIVSAFLALLMAEVYLVLICAAVKKLLVGSVWGSAHSTPFWSWRHFSYFFVQDCFFAWCRRPLYMSAGTLFSSSILRTMGCRIGRRTIINSPMQASDWNAVNFGSDCVVNGFLQFHTFEDMILKVKQTDIRDGSAINFGATVMGGAVIEPETTIAPLSLVLKEMHLAGATSYQGSPVEPPGDN